MGVSLILTRLARIRQDLSITYGYRVKHFLSFKRPKCGVYISCIDRLKGDVLEFNTHIWVYLKHFNFPITRCFR